MAGTGGGHGELVAVDVAVIAQHVDRDGGVLIGPGGVAGGHRIVVDAADGDRDRGVRRAALPVTDVIGDGVTAVVVGVRCIGQSAVGIHGDRAMEGARAGDAQLVAVDIAVIAENSHGNGCVLVGRRAVAHGNRVIVHRV